MEKYSGLSSEAVKSRQQQFGYNQIPSEKPKSLFTQIRLVLTEPMILLLLLTGTVYLILGEAKDSIALFVSIFFVIGITLYQERKTEKALEALKDLSSPRALVIRNGQRQRIAGKDVVVDDIIVLQEGDRIPADSVVLSSQNLLINESLLTGESLPVRKEVWDGKQEVKIGSENTSFVFSGTLVSQGSGIARVISIGVDTQMGKIGKTLQTIQNSQSLLKIEINRIIRLYGLVGAIACLLFFVAYVWLKGDILTAILRGLTLAMSMLPEEFPMVLTIFLALGAWRISRKNVLTRDSQAIETLGATTVLCVDKTGTLTANHMTLSSLVTDKDTFDLTANQSLSTTAKQVLHYAKLASKRSAFDPLEIEINNKFDDLLAQDYPIKDWHLLTSYDLTQDQLSISRIWDVPDSSTHLVAAKGAPEAILKLTQSNQPDQQFWLAKVKQMSDQGQRVLAVAQGQFSGSDFPESQTDLSLKFLGLIGFVDPLRPTVSHSMAECAKAGIRVIMITGDYSGTASFIAAQAGIKNPDQFITGTELEKLDIGELRQKIKQINVFARVVPDQKLKIVQALKANGEIVAMTGDGVNDGPALKAAHIGIAMGEKGTDVARESADLVLLDDNFTSIVAAIKLGRRIYDNLQKAISFIFSVHIPIAGVTLIPVFLNLPFLLYPIHVAFLELIIDPACSLVFESEKSEGDIMSRSPRPLGQPLFNHTQLIKGTLHGLVVLATIIFVFIVSLQFGATEGVARSLAFTTMVLCNLALIRADLTKTSIFEKPSFHFNKSFTIIFISTLSIVLITIFNPFFRNLFHFSPVKITQLLTITLLALICYLILEFLKLFHSKAEK